MQQTPKTPKKRLSPKNRGLVPTIQPEPDFSWTCGFRYELDNVELVMYVKFQKHLMTGCRDMDKKPQKLPKNGVFPSVTLYPYGALTSCKKLEKTMSGL